MVLPVGLTMFYALDPRETSAFPKTTVKDAGVDTWRGKTGQPIYLPIFEPFAHALEMAPTYAAITLCATSHGKPWTYNGFSTKWDKLKKKLEETGTVQPRLTLKGLRHTVATILREVGRDYGIVQLVLGHATEARARRYSRRTDMTKQVTVMTVNF